MDATMATQFLGDCHASGTRRAEASRAAGACHTRPPFFEPRPRPPPPKSTADRRASSLVLRAFLIATPNDSCTVLTWRREVGSPVARSTARHERMAGGYVQLLHPWPTLIKALYMQAVTARGKKLRRRQRVMATNANKNDPVVIRRLDL